MSKVLDHFESLKFSKEIKNLTFGIDFIKIFKSISDLINKPETLEKLNDKVNTLLAKSEYKIAIIIDDVDRLDKDEIYSLFKLIKLNAYFQNTIYILSLDSEQVSKAIHARYGNEVNDGRYFIDKIINIPIVLPRIEKEDLQLFFEKRLSILKKKLLLNEKKEEEFKKIIFNFNDYFFESPRHIIKTLNSFAISALAIGSEVNLEDLFGIEYLKITHENCYQEIKKFQDNSMFNSFRDIIDFNISDDKSGEPSGFRKELLEKYPAANPIITKLFPEYNQNWQQETHHFNPQKLKKELRINTADHFDKYFTYHTLRKIPEKLLEKLVELILLTKEDEAIAIINNLFQNIDIHKVILRFERLIEETDDRNKNKILLFFAKHIQLIPDTGNDMFGQNFQTRFIEKIAVVLNESSTENTGVISDIASYFDTIQLCRFTRKFDENKSFKKDLYKMIVDKTKEEESVFFEVPENLHNKMVMFSWNKVNEDEFANFIMDKLNQSNVDLLIRNFPSFWNNTYFGGLSRDNYNFMKSQIDVDLVYKILKDKYPDKTNQSYTQDKLIDMSSSDMDPNTIEQNVGQFIYWYELDKKKVEDA